MKETSMNLVLNTPLEAFVSKQEYDNRILYVFLVLMAALVVLSLVFINFSKRFTENNSVLNPDQPTNTLSNTHYV
jgi:hypothetical protein